QFVTDLGQPHAAICAGEQWRIELVLEPLHVPSERRLGDLQMRRGSGDAAELGDADEVMQAAQLHDRAISRPAGADVNQNSLFALMPGWHRHDRKSVFAR